MAAHPTDAERAERVAGVRARVDDALRDGDGDALAGLLRSDAAWVSADGVHDGDDARARARELAGRGVAWQAPQVSGARAVWRGAGGTDAFVAEMRGGAVVWVAQLP
ncbi:MAG: hypothetical protein KDC33_02065 [Thermoleophilia bacterium]|nr:hypothetical protein [Thermoleophilia bacterium]